MKNINDFSALYNVGKSQLLVKELIVDTETPISVFLKLRADKRVSVLFESVEGGEVLGRFSAIGIDPDRAWICQNGKSCLFSIENPSHQAVFSDAPSLVNLDEFETSGQPLQHLRECTSEAKLDEEGLEQYPPMLSSGYFGMLGYDCIRLVENIPDSNPDTLKIPDAAMIRPRLMCVFDNIKHVIYLACPVREHKGNSSRNAEEAYAEFKDYIEHASMRIYSTNIEEHNSTKMEQTAQSTNLTIRSNFTLDEYKKVVEKAKKYIVEGDIFQVVPSQRFECDFKLSPFSLYRSLRRLNPSPFLFFLNFGQYALCGSSPEILVRSRDNKVTIRPIAGTRKRGANEAEDIALEKDLLADPKELAEHLMLLDLGRNDVGRVSKIGSVNVTQSHIIERYSHVMHIVSNVEGELNTDKHDALDALFSGFPAGTVSGAPKIRAMEIIDELETVKRKFYAGCVGYMDGQGNIDSCIALRTGLIKDDKLFIQAGGGVVADSDAQSEYEETVNKSKALRAAASDALQRYS
jgi:anthranilate synthase component 1